MYEERCEKRRFQSYNLEEDGATDGVNNRGYYHASQDDVEE